MMPDLDERCQLGPPIVVLVPFSHDGSLTEGVLAGQTRSEAFWTLHDPRVAPFRWHGCTRAIAASPTDVRDPSGGTPSYAFFVPGPTIVTGHGAWLAQCWLMEPNNFPTTWVCP
jgi:hypothetical protein